jgi:general secretion pathway protein E
MQGLKEVSSLSSEVLVMKSAITDQSLETLAKESGITFVKDLSTFSFIKGKVRLFSYAFVKKNGIIPLKEEEETLYIAISDPYDLQTIEEVRYLSKKEIKEVLAPKSTIESAIESCYGQKEEEASLYIQGLEDSGSSETLVSSEREYDLLASETDSSVVKVLNMILIEALGQTVSDIHFEPVESGLIVRYRIDGVLQMKHNLSKELQKPLTTRIKVLAQLDIAEHRLPQDGRVKLRMGGREIDFRVSTIPVVFGERVVLRILDRSSVSAQLNKLGISDDLLEEIRFFTKCGQGIILVTGPTGSGKSTTLHAMLSEMRSSEVNIMTIEDPVEFKTEGMAQISVNPKIDLTFAKGLRHILRQDPDVIMIGEIRDKETAEIAVQASLTGHLVLSTLHTNDAPSAIARLVDMGIEPYLLSSSLIAVLAQRLVRQICPKCKELYKPTSEELSELHSPPPSITLYKGAGCDFCFKTGYKGRVPLYELMPVTRRVKEQILKSANAAELKKIAIDGGMKTLSSEGERLAFEGKTSLAEMLRVTRQMSEE